MNKIFKVIWNHATQTFTVVSELAKNRGKVTAQADERDSVSVSGDQGFGRGGIKLTALSLLVLSTFVPKADAAIAIGTNSGDYAIRGAGTTESSVSRGTSNTSVYAYNYYNPGSKSYSSATTLEGDNYSMTNWSEGIAIGRNTNAFSRDGAASSVAIGDYANTSGALSIAIGPMARTGNIGSVAIGTASRADGFNSLSIMRQSAATNNFAMAMGSAAWADGRSSVAMGSSATAKGKQSFALGSADHVNLDGKPGSETLRTKYDGMNNTQSNGDRSFAIGTSAKTNGNDSFALGSDARTGIFTTTYDNFLQSSVLTPGAEAKSSFAMGTQARASQERAFALGTTTNATGVDSFALGTNATANQTRSIAFGTNTTSTGVDSFALGTEADATANNTVALGTNANATKEGAFALGTKASATNVSALALGQEAKAFGCVSVAIGGAAHATQENSMAIGREARSYGNNSIAMGSYANVATAERSISIGTSSVVRTDKTVAIGSEASVGQNASGSVAIGETSNIAKNAENSTAIGFNSNVTAKNASAIGAKAVASHENAVAIGSNSVTRGATQENSATVNGITYGGFSGSNPSSVVSVGSDNIKRQIVNVAAGNISSSSTDAINGSQLYATNNIIGNVAKSVVQNFGGDAKVDANGNITFSNIGGTGKETIHEAIKAAKTEVKAGTNTRVENTTSADGHIVYTVHANNTKVTEGNGINVTSTTNAQNETSYTVALSEETKTQLKKEESASAGNSNVKVTENSSVNNTGGKDYVITLNNTLNLTDSGSVTIGGTVVNNDGLKITNGPNITTSGIDAGNKKITNVENGTISDSSKDAVNGSQLYATNQNVTNISNQVAKGWNLTTSGNTTGTPTVEKVAMGDTVTIDGGKNINITQTGKKISIATSMTPNFTTVTTGNTTISNDGVSITGGTNGTVSITKDGLNNSNNTIKNVAPGVNGTDAVNKNQLETVNKTASAGWNLTINEGKNSTNVAPNATVDLANKDGNIVITKEKNNVTFALNNKLTIGGKDGQNGKIGLDGANGTIGLNGKDGASANITVKNGKPGVDGKDGESKTRIVYEKPDGTTEEVATLNDGLIFTGNNEVKNVHKLNSVVKLVGEGVDKATSEKFSSAAGNINVKANGTDTLEIQLNKNVNLTKDGSVIIGNSTVNNNGLTITGGPSITKDGGINAGDKKITNVSEGEVSSTSKEAVNGSQLYATNQNVTNISNQVAKGWNLTTSGNTTTKDTVAKIEMGDTVTIDGGHNINVTQTDKKISIATSMTPTFTTVTTGNTTLNTDGVTITGGKENVTITKDGLNNGNNTITGVAPGVNGTDAVNKDQLEKVNSTASAGWNLTVNGTNSSNVAPNATVDLANKDGNIIITKDKNNVTFALNDKLTIGGKDGKIGLDGTNGTIGLNGKDGASANITVQNGKPGINGKDGENLTRIVYTDPKGVTHEVATLDDGLKFAGNKGDIIAKKLGETLSVVGELANTSLASAKNIRVDSENGKLVVKIAESPNFTSVVTGNTTTNNDGVTITGGANGTVSLTDKGLNNGNNTITNVANGTISADSKEAVNGSQLYATNQNVTNITNEVAKGWNLTTSGNTNNPTKVEKIAMGDTVTIDGGSNINITQDGKKITIATSMTPTFTTVTTGNTTINTDGMTITGGKNNTVSITKDGLNNGNNTITNVAPGVNGTDAVNKNQLDKVNSTASAGWNLTVNATDSSNVAPNATVDLANKDGNIIITKDKNNVTFALNDKLTIGGKDGQNGKIGLDGANGTIGLTGPKGADGKNGASANITVKDGKPGIDGKDGDTLTRIVYTDSNGKTHEVATLEDGLKFAGNQGNTIAKKLGETLDVVGKLDNASAASAKNIRVDSEDGKLVVKISENPNFTSVVTGNTTTNNNGVTITGGTNGTVTLTDKGLNNGNNTITNVANGTISADSKEAVNGSQLYATNQNVTNIKNEVAKGWNLTTSGNATNTTLAQVSMGDTVTIDGGSNINITQNGKTISIATSMKPNFTTVTTGNTTINTDGMTITGGNKDTVSITKDGLNNGNNTITNVAPGVNGTDAVNKDQLEKVNSTASAGWNLTINSGQNSSNIAPNATVDLANKDGNIVITKDANNVTFALNSNLTIGGKDGKDGKIGLDGANGTIGLTGPKGADGKDGASASISVKDGSKGIDGNDGKNGESKTRIIYKKPDGTTEEIATLNDGLYFTGDNTSSVIAKKLNETLTIKGNLAETAAVTDKNLRVDNVDGSLVVKMAKSLVDLTNATFTDSTGKLTTVISGNGTTISGGANGTVSLTDKGLNNGNNTITNVAPGVNGTDAVNKDQLEKVNSTASAGWNLTINSGQNGSNIAPNATVDLANKDGNIVITKDANNVTFALNSNLTIGGKDGKDGQIGISGKDGKDGVVINGNGTIGINGKDGVNGKPGSNATLTVVEGTPGINGKDGETLTRIVYTDSNGTTHEVATLDDGLKFAGNKGETIAKKLGETLTVVGALANETAASANNIRVDSEGGKLVVKIAENPNFTSVVTGNTTTNTNGVTITGGANGTVSLTDKGLNNGNNTITNVAPGVNGTDAVNKDQLEKVNSTASAGWNLTVNGTNSSNVAPNATVDLANKDGNIVITKDANNVTFALNNNLTIGGKDGKDGQIGISGKDGKDGVVINGNGTVIAGRDGVDGVDGQIGATGKDGASVVLNGKDGSIGLTGPKGADGKDGASANISVKDGAKGLAGNDGKDGESKTRIVYEKPNGETETIATLNDGLYFTGDNTSSVIAKKLNETLTIKGNLTETAAVTDKNLRVDNVGGALVVKMAKSLVDLTNATFTDSTGKTTVISGNGTTISGGANGTVSLTDKGLNNGNNTITNVAPGVNGTDAVNKDQLEAVNKTASAGWNLTVNGTNSSNVAPNATVDLANKDGNIVITKDANNVTFALNNNLTIGGKDGKDGQIGISGKDGKDGVVINGNGTVIAGRDGVDGVDGQIGAKGKDGASVVLNGKDGSIGLTGPKGADGKDGASANISVKDGAKGLDGNDGKDGESKTRIVYEKPNGETETIATLNDGLYFTGDNTSSVIAKKLNETLTIKGNLTETAAVTDKNLRVDNVGGALVVKMAKSLVDLTNATFTDSTGKTTVISGNGTTISGGANGTVSLTDKGLNNGNNTITNVAPGVNGTDAVNKDQLEAVNKTASAGWNLTVNGTNSSNVAPNATVDLANTDGNIVITKDANNVTFALNSNLTIGGKDGKDGQIGISGKDGKDGVVINGNGTVIAGRDGVDGVDGQIGAKGKDGASVVLNGKDGSIGLTGPKGADGKDGASANISVKDGAKGLDGNDGKDGESKTRIVYEKPNGETETIATLNDGLIFTGNNEVKNNHKLNSVVKLVGEGVDKAASEKFSSASGNINVKANGSDTLEVQLNKDVNLTKDGSVTIGDTVVNNDGVKVGDTSLTQDGLTIKDGPSITKDGINAGDKVITGVADGDISATSTEAVNGSQLYTVQEAAKAAKTEVKQGDNITVTETTGKNGQSIYTVSVNKDLDLTKDGSVTIGNTVVNNDGVKVGDTSLTQDGLTIKDGPSITKDGINAGNKVITGVADGDISATSTEAINGSQLYNVKNELTKNAFGLKDESGNAIVQDLGTTVSVVGDGNVKTNVITKGDGSKALEVSLGTDILVGKNGADGKDGSIGVTGKDGASVVLNGKDGSIGLTGPKGADGKNGASANISVKDGAKGLDGNDGKDGESKTRIVYEKPDGTTEEIATLNDGLIFTGNNEVKNNHKLNSVVKLVGEGVDKAASEKFSSASGNINVKANGSDTLEVQLNKDVNLTKDGSVTIGDTTVNNNGLTINGGPSITKDGGINAGCQSYK